MLISSLKKLLMYLLVFMPAIVFSQVKVTHMDAGFKPEKGGVVYALPRTLVKVDVVIARKELVAGPFRSYAEEYLGITNYIHANSVEYSLKDISLSAVSEPDPDQYYYISPEPKTSREAWQTILNLNGVGIITSLNTSGELKSPAPTAVENSLSPDEIMQIFSKYADLNIFEKVDTVAKTIHLDTMTITNYTFHTSITEKPLKVRAEEAARMLKNIRDSRYNLLIGYQEINYSEGALKFMNEELLALEQEYLSLFTGASSTTALQYSFIYIPATGSLGSTVPVFKLSKSAGIQESGSGENISIRITTSGNTAGISSTAVPSGGLPYRMPESAEVKLFYGGNVVAQASMPFSQFGKLASLPAGASDVSFDENTGGLKRVKLVAE